MKIIHCADIHIDVKDVRGLGAEERKIKRNQLIQNFFDLIAYAKTNEVDAILLCGDIFDVPSPSKNSVNLFKKAILGAPNIKFFYIYGNHDEGFCPFSEGEAENFVYFKDKFAKVDLADNVTVGGVSTTRYLQNSFYYLSALKYMQYQKSIYKKDTRKYLSLSMREIYFIQYFLLL